MPLTVGTRLGPYEVLAPLGVGGMGEVYRARDTTLDRAVAIKVLPESLADDPDRLARFDREAKTLAALNHPNIAGIHGFETATLAGQATIKALVMELVEGPTLADRIAQGRLPLDDALPIARQIADALEAAHDQGIVHRDLKPANIKLRPDGTVKVLDFGLAKALGSDGSGAGAAPMSNSPTITSPVMTRMGVILGTAAYMAPEQARGKVVDQRADLWAFGCVLYEMLSGRPAFDGAEVTDVLARVIERDPDVSALPANTPASIRRLLRRCLEKDRKRRLAHASDARLEIDEALSAPGSDPTPAAAIEPRRPLWRRALPAATVIIVGFAAGYAGWTLKPAPPRPVTRLEVPLLEGERLTAGSVLALSPDGTRLAFAANDRLYVRSLDQLDAAQITGGTVQPLASPRTPFFSPDSQWLGFWEAGHLKKVSVSGGAPVTLTELRPPPLGATWAADNTILLGRGSDGVWRLPDTGGIPERIIAVDAGQRAHRPQLLPDRRTVLFTLAHTASWDEAEIIVHSLDDGRRETLVKGGTDGWYLPTGHLVYALRDTLLGVPFDPASRRITGGPVPLLAGVLRPAGPRGSYAGFAVSRAGTLAYLPAGDAVPLRRTLVWVDRQGREEAIPAQPGSYTHPRLAPDGTRLAVEMLDEDRNPDIWVWEFSGRRWTRVVSDPASDREPVWTPDGQRLIFTSLRTGAIALFRQAANGTGTAEQLADLNRQNSALPALSPDGRFVVVRDNEAGSSFLALLDVGADRNAGTPGRPEARPLVKTAFEEINAAISPNGRWLAYQSNTSGVFDVYVRPFPEVETGQWVVSAAGGSEPVWSRDGRELFYRSPAGAVMRVPVAPGDAWSAGPALQLFDTASYTHGGGGPRGPLMSRTYDVSPDGKRFLMMKNADGSAQPPAAPRVVIVQNWFDELLRLAPPNPRGR